MTKISDELKRLDETLAAFGEDADVPFGIELMRGSLERHRSGLLAQLDEQQLDLALTRNIQRGTGGELKLVSAVLAALQDSLSSIAQAIAGRPTTRGLIPVAVTESVELRVAAASVGSLRLRLIPANPEAQLPLFEDDDSSALDLSILRLTELLTAATRGSEDILGHVAEIGPRATSHVGTLAKTLADAGASLALDWSSPRQQQSARLDVRGASTLQHTFELVDEEYETLVFTGRLTGGSLVRSTFEFEVEGGSVIRGLADAEVLPNLERLFGSECAATLLVHQTKLRTGETKETYRLQALSD